MKKKNQSDYFISTFIDDLYLSTLLHDVGKVGIPDGILFKPGRLSPEEFSVMKLHANIGQETIQKAQTRLGDGSFLTMGISIAGYHHERWDGTGYPEGLAGEKIPLAARIVSIADVYDALNSPRVYKEAWSHQKTVEFMVNGSGTQFDPELIKIFIEEVKNFETIRDEMKDESIGL
jgi:HD-GYP domain-containing protein (c-di-GMP phosphodiesterase class II)